MSKAQVERAKHKRHISVNSICGDPFIPGSHLLGECVLSNLLGRIPESALGAMIVGGISLAVAG